MKFKDLLLTVILLLVFALTGVACVDHEKQQGLMEEEVGNWWSEYDQLTQASETITNKVTAAIEYSGWINEPLEIVKNSIKEYYAEPLATEIINSVVDFRQEATDWYDSSSVDRVFLFEENKDQTIIIAEIIETLHDDVTGRGLALITLNKDIKITDRLYQWEY